MKILNWGILLFWEEKKILKIRKFERADLPQVLELCREVRQYHTDILGGYFAEQDDAFEQSGFLATLEDDRMTALVAEEGEEINGYLLAEKKYSPYLREPNVVHISNIGVKKGLPPGAWPQGRRVCSRAGAQRGKEPAGPFPLKQRCRRERD